MGIKSVVRGLGWGVLVFLLSGVVFFSMLMGMGQAQITLDGSLGPSGDLNGTGGLIDIPAEVGQIHGSNLFHSFGEFNVPMGGSATFTGPSSIRNIIGRVTGGNESHINGTLGLGMEISEANLFLLNPSGIMGLDHGVGRL